VAGYPAGSQGKTGAFYLISDYTAVINTGNKGDADYKSNLLHQKLKSVMDSRLFCQNPFYAG